MKFCEFTIESAATAISPTVSGLIAFKAASIQRLLRKAKKNLHTANIINNEGRQTAIVAMMEPKTFPVAVYPT